MDLRKILVPKTAVILFFAIIVNMILYTFGMSNDKQNKEKYLENQKEYVSGFNAYVNKVISNAKGMSEISIFSKEGSVSSENIDKAAKAYERIKDIELKNEDNRAVRYYLDYSYGIIIATLIMIYLIYLMFEDRTNGMWQLTYSSADGRLKLTVVRMCILSVFGFASLVVLELPRLIYTFAKYGNIRIMFTFIQNIEGYQDFTYPLSKCEYILTLTFIQWLVVVCISFFVFALFSVFRNRNYPLVILSVIGVIEYLLYINTSSITVLTILRHVNICKLFDINAILKRFYNVNIKNIVCTDMRLIILIIIVTIIISSFISIVSNILMKPYGRYTVVIKMTEDINRVYQKLLCSYPFFLKEIHKAVVSGRGIVIIVAVFTATLYFSANGVERYAETVISKEKMYEQYGGEDYQEINIIIDNLNLNYEAAKENMRKAELSYKAGNASYEEYSQCAGALLYYSGQLSSYDEFEQKRSYLNQLKAKTGIDGWMVSERGYGNLFGTDAIIREYLLALIMALSITIITFEYLMTDQKSGTIKIIRCAKKGKRSYSVMRLSICLLLAVVLYVIVYGIDYYYIFNSYIIQGVDAPVQSLMFMEKMNLKITIREWIIIRQLIRLAESVLSIFISYVAFIVALKNSNKAVVIVLCVMEILVLTFFEKGVWGLWN